MTASKYPKYIVLDTSVVLKWYLDETGSISSRNWRKQIKYGKTLGVIPEYLLFELSNVLLTKYKISLENVKLILSDINNLGLYTIKFSDLSLSLILSIADKYQIAIYDAIFIESAIMANCKLLTADKLLLNKLPGSTLAL